MSYTLRHTFPHFLSILVVICYSIFGALIFQQIERQRDLTQKNETVDALRLQLKEFLIALKSETSSSKTYYKLKIDLRQLMQKQEQAFIDKRTSYRYLFDREDSVPSDWDFANSILFCFTVITTIGYGNIAPKTHLGRIFCIIYGFIGIPITMLAIANIGKFLSEFGHYIYERMKVGNEKRRVTVGNAPVKSLFMVFSIYIVLGTAILPLWEDLGYLASCYLSFITITTCGFGDIVPEKRHYYFPTIIYFTFGLSIASLTIDVAASYFRKLHYYAAKISGAKDAIVWFGSKVLTVGEVAMAVGKEHGIPQHNMHQMLEDDNFDRMMTEAVAAKETRQSEKSNEKSKKNSLKKGIKQYFDVDDDAQIIGSDPTNNRPFKVEAPLFDDYPEFRSIDNSTPSSHHLSRKSSRRKSFVSPLNLISQDEDQPPEDWPKVMQPLSTKSSSCVSTPTGSGVRLIHLGSDLESDEDGTEVDVNVTMNFGFP